MHLTSCTIRWLHLSDFHVGKDDYAQRRMFERIIEHAKAKKDTGFMPNFIFITGDLANKGKADEYALFNDGFLSQLQDTLGDGIDSRTFAIPGNHDADRSKNQAFDRVEMALPEAKCFDPTQDGHASRDLLLPRFEAFASNDKTHAKGRCCSSPEGAFAHIEDVLGIKVGIVGVNTAWLSKDEKDRENLTPGKALLEHALVKVLDCALRIVLGHHPLDWFIPEQRKMIESLLGKSSVIYLHGHLHDVWAAPGYGGGHDFLAVQSGAGFQAREGEIWRNGLIWGEVCVDRKVLELQPWEWNATHQDWSLVADAFPNVCRRGDVWEYPLPGSKQSIAAPKPGSVVSKDATPMGWPVIKLSELLAQPGPSSAAPTVSYPGTPADFVLNDPPYVQTVSLESFLTQPTGTQKTTPSYLPLEATDIVVARVFGIPSPRQDIEIHEISPDSVAWPDKPNHEKSPLLQELRTPNQIREHFLALPRVTDHIDDWLACKHDLLFLGLLFCGQTSLLTYLWVEAARKHGASIRPILLKPREDLPLEGVEAAVVRLKKRLEKMRSKSDGRQTLLLLDNVHNQVHFEIACRIMTSPRPWRVWGAARSGEYARLEITGKESPWDESNVIREACSLVGTSEAEWMTKHVLRPNLEIWNKADQESEVLEALKAAGQVPTRFLVQVWGLIKDDKADVDTGYREVIRNLPKDLDAVVQFLRPRGIIGMQALVVTDFLRNPPWEVLNGVLAVIDEHGAKLARETIAELRRASSLVPDSEYPFRATMYDPIREEVRSEGNLSKQLKAQIWTGLLSYLQDADRVEQGPPAVLAHYWGELRELERDSMQPEARIACAQRALKYAAEGDDRVEALWELGLAKLLRGEDGLHEAHRDFSEAVDLADRLGQETKNAAYAMGLWAVFHPSKNSEALKQILARLADAKRICAMLGEDSDVAFIAENIAKVLLAGPRRDAAEALLHVKDALEARKKLKKPAELPSTLVLLARCLREQPQPEWTEAIQRSREAVELLTGDEQRADRAQTLYQLAFCLHSQPQPEWTEAIQRSREAVELLTGDEQRADRVQTLYQLAFCLRSQPQPEWTEAIQRSREAVELLTGDEQRADRARTLYQLAFCLRSQPQPEWTEAIQRSREAVELLTGDEQRADRVQTLYQLAFCLRSQPQPEWTEAIQRYREAVELLTGDEQRADRVQTLYQLAFCLRSQPQPEWTEAIQRYREAVELLTGDEQRADRVQTLYQLAFCLRSQPQPEWTEAIRCSKQAVSLLKASERGGDLEAALVQLASLLKDQDTPDMRAAVEVWQEAAEQFPSPNVIIGLVMSLDRAGNFGEGDRWSTKLHTSNLGGKNEATDSPLSRRRQGYLALRRNELDTVVAIASELRGTSENARAMLLLSVAYFARTEHEKARECIKSAQADHTDITWFNPIVASYFARYSREDIDPYQGLLSRYYP